MYKQKDLPFIVGYVYSTSTIKRRPRASTIHYKYVLNEHVRMMSLTLSKNSLISPGAFGSGLVCLRCSSRKLGFNTNSYQAGM